VGRGQTNVTVGQTDCLGKYSFRFFLASKGRKYYDLLVTALSHYLAGNGLKFLRQNGYIGSSLCTAGWGRFLIKFNVLETKPTQGCSVCFKDSKNV